MKRISYKLGLIVLFLSLFLNLSACSNVGTKYQLPDYYKTELLPNIYQFGEVYRVKDLQQSEVTRSQRRIYEKRYFFE